MATKAELHAMITQAVADPAYRKFLVSNPVQAAEAMGYILTDTQVSALKGADGVSSAGRLEKRISKQIG